MTLKMATGTAAVLAMACLAQAGTILIDFGYGSPANLSNTDPANGNVWNNVASNYGTAVLPTAASPLSLKLTDGTSSGATLSVSGIGSGNTINSGPGSTSYASTAVSGTAASLGITSTAARDSLGVYGSEKGTITITGLDTSSKYTIYLFSSWLGTTTDVTDRNTLYTVTGSGAAQTAVLQVRGNTSEVATFTDITASGGTLTIKLERASSSVVWSTIGAVEIVSTPIPEPASLGALTVIGAGLLWRHRK